MIDHHSAYLPRAGPIYQCLAPWTEAALRAVVGLWLVPHGLRNTFGFFPTTGVRANNLAALAAQLDRDGYRPGSCGRRRSRSRSSSAARCSRSGCSRALAAFAILMFLLVTNVERWRVGR